MCLFPWKFVHLKVLGEKNSANPNPIFLNNTEPLSLSQNSLIEEKKYYINKTLKTVEEEQKAKSECPAFRFTCFKMRFHGIPISKFSPGKRILDFFY